MTATSKRGTVRIASTNPFSGLVTLQKTREVARIQKKKLEHQRRFDGFGTDGLRIWNELVDKGAAQWLQMLVFLRHIAGEKQIDVCFMRRDLVHGQRLGERGATFSPAGKGPLAVLDLDDLIDKPAPLKRWVKAGATARHEWNRAYALEAELHMRMSSQTRDVVMLDDLSEARVIEIRRRGLWRVVLETSPENFQVLMLLPVSVGADARQAAQASLASFLGGDLGSVAADKWHRLPGSKNNKMGPDGRGINWFCQMRDCCDGDPVPMAWLPDGWPVVHVSTVVAADVHAPDSSPVGSVVAQVPSSRVALGAITLPAGLAHIKNASVREFASAAEYLKAGAWLQDVLVYLAALADGRDKYKKVKGGALAYALRTLAGVMAEFEFSSDQQMRSLYVLHSEESRQLGCHPEDFPKARGAAAGRAARRLR